LGIAWTNQGIFKEKFGGFVDPSCLMINKVACPLAAHHWNFPLNAFLCRNHKSRGTGQPSVFYTLNVNDGRHPMRVQLGPAYDQAGSSPCAA
jgi:hypothetical protein